MTTSVVRLGMKNSRSLLLLYSGGEGLVMRGSVEVSGFRFQVSGQKSFPFESVCLTPAQPLSPSSSALSTEVRGAWLGAVALSFLIGAQFIFALVAVATEPEMLVASGQTMGSTYTVKVFDPPAGFSDDWQLLVDRELRLITDQMSTYIESSEISRFNASTSLEWFPVSSELALVVSKADEMSRLSEGAFDITVLPLVKAWSFGPSKKRGMPPAVAELEDLRKFVGYQNVEARLAPPGLKKRIPELTIDLNAIAPGHGADRLVTLLNGLGASNLFVEVGGEVRVTGDKAGQPWMVGIQQPDVSGEVVAVAYPLRDRSMATSGDYRSYFEFEGKRYSHTIDPRTARPVTHHLASVTVLAEDCMTADALATALNVLGEHDGLTFAQQHGIDALLMVRSDQGEISLLATGGFESVVAPPAALKINDTTTSFLPIAVGCFVVFGLVIAAMAVGVMFGRRAISGSCGGLANSQDGDGKTSCSLCSNPADACKDLRSRMNKPAAP